MAEINSASMTSSAESPAHSTTQSSAKVAVVTGAGSGAGRAVALEPARAGWSVTLAGRREAMLEETARLAREGAPVLAVRADITRPEGRTAHQQRLCLGSCAAPEQHRLHRHQARRLRSHQVAVAGGRKYGIACGQIDIGNAATEMTEQMRTGILQAD